MIIIGRNSGFLNMLNLMKIKAKSVVGGSSSGEEVKVESSNDGDSNDNISGNTGAPIYDAIITKLLQLQPQLLELEDESYKHAGHAGTQGLASSETHFNLKIISTAFENLSLVKRHKMIYTLLGESGGVSVSVLVC